MVMRHPPMVMKASDIRKRMRLLRAWDFACVVCGYGFEDISSVTVEHLIPRCEGGSNAKENIAPSHHACNELRGAKCLRKAARLVARKQRGMCAKSFRQWLNKAVPHRVIPREVWVPIRVPLCLEPPEFLPGLL